jgi:uncharacterized protein
MINRRMFDKVCSAGVLVLACSALAACSSPSAPLHYYRLPSEPPAGEAAARAAVASASGGAVWELVPSLPMPELLGRDTLFVEEGTAGIRLLHGHRWAEPLRDALPRLLRDDLARWVPGLWSGPATPNVQNMPPAGRVQVELLALHGSLPRRQVVLAARWVVTPAASNEPGARAGPRAYRADEVVPWTEASPESLVVAQRVAMWRLAQRIAASLQGGG